MNNYAFNKMTKLQSCQSKDGTQGMSLLTPF